MPSFPQGSEVIFGLRISGFFRISRIRISEFESERSTGV